MNVNFQPFARLIAEHFARMTEGVEMLYTVDVDRDQLWNYYLDSYPAGTNEVYRVRRQYDCSCCRHFVRTMGNVVVLQNQEVHTIWEISGAPAPYQEVADAMDAYVRAAPISGVFLARQASVGAEFSYEQLEDCSVDTWAHFHLTLPKRFVVQTDATVEEFIGRQAASKQVFQRALEEIAPDAVDTVLELIAQKSLYRGEEWQGLLTSFRAIQDEYADLPAEKREFYLWEKLATVGGAMTRIRNHSIGTLLTDLSDDMDLEAALRRYETVVAPTNYKRPKAVYTKETLEAARKTLEQLGYLGSLGRRFATLDDIRISNILFCNRDAARRISGSSVFDAMLEALSLSPRAFARVEEVSAEDFVSRVLPTAREVEVMLENRHARHLVSLIAPKDPESPSMFKWDNAFGWSYNGNITDSIKERVKAAGGSVDGVLRFSIQWNDEDGQNLSDLDAHCIQPNREEIFFGHKNARTSGGALDVDIIHPEEGVAAVENITWPSTQFMPEGEYRFFVHCYTRRAGNTGFKAQIEFDGTVYNFDYPFSLRQEECVEVATVTYRKDQGFTIKPALSASASARELWGLRTNRFVPVSVILYSPNYWDSQHGIGHRHYFFMLKDCKNPDTPNGWYNEFLKEELMPHKCVLEALGSRMQVEPADEQLSGLGFSATKHDELTVKVRGASERILKIRF